MSCKPNRRVPQCARCRSHNTFSNVRGHKKSCRWKDCTCTKCQMVTEKRRVTAVRVAILRQERKRRMASRRLNYTNFHFGPSSGAWGMMGNMSGTYTAEQLMDNRRMLMQNETFRHDLYHNSHVTYSPLQYTYDNDYLYAGLLHDEKTQAKESPPDINRNVKSFEHEYVSLMRKPDEDDVEGLLPGDSSPRHQYHVISKPCQNEPQRIFTRQVSPTFYLNSPTHADPYRSQVSQEPPKYVSMMLNATPSLPCTYPIGSSHRIPYHVGF